MEIVAKPSGRGKTTDAVRMALESDCYLVVRDHKTAQRIASENVELLRFPLTYAELMGTGLYGSHIRTIVIDDADDFIRYVCHSQGVESIKAITLTKEE